MSKVLKETLCNATQQLTSSSSKTRDNIEYGSQAESLLTSKQMSELLPVRDTHSAPALSSLHADSSVIIPINDIDGASMTGYSENEQLMRCKLASLYRLIDLFRCSQGIYNHVTARATEEQEHFLINPFGLLYNKITASSLVKVDVSGNVIDPGSTRFGINHAGYTLHSAIHKVRPDLKCVIHLHTPAVAAVSSMKCGLLPLSQEALFCGNISYHDYRGILIEEDVKTIIAKDLGSINKVMILRNHGFVACGETIEEAWAYAFNVIKASEIQTRVMSVGIDQLYLQSDEKEKQIIDLLRGDNNEIIGNRKWRIGELEFESLMRIMDDAGYRTGYLYRQPLTYNTDKTTAITQMKIKPSASSASPFLNQ